MGQLVVLSLGTGSCSEGFQTVTAQLWEGQIAVPVKFSGGLPACLELEQLYERWQQLYHALYARLNWRRSTERHSARGSTAAGADLGTSAGINAGINLGTNIEDLIEFDSDGLNRVSEAEFHDLCRQLQTCLNRWLQSPEFIAIDQRLRTRLDAAQQIRVVVETDDLLLRHLPWHLWNLLELCPQAHIAMSAQDYEHLKPAAAPLNPAQPDPAQPKTQVRILAILGHSDGIDVQQDRQVLEQLTSAEVVFLTEPQRKDLDHWLWHPDGWDILFFAGHSSSQRTQGELYLNPNQTLTIEQLRNALKASIRRGLQLAIFNSCDGLGLARDLDDLNLPQLIVMREPVPDQVAQIFLKHFLQLLSAGESLFPAVRQAQERLQGLESEFPCASWLPTICQNPAAPTLRWPQPVPEIVLEATLETPSSLNPSPAMPPSAAGPRSAPRSMPRSMPRESPWSWRSLTALLATSLGITALVLGIRATGKLRPLELWTYDRLTRLLPDEDPDDRILLVEVNEQDLRQYGWPLSDELLEQLLTKINAAQPRVIGIDIFRDLPQEPGHEALRQFWQTHDNAIAICLHSDVENPGIPPPAGLPEAQVGFNDVVLDANDTVRRQLWAMGPTTRSECTTQLSFSLVLALRYLEAEGTEVGRGEDGSIQLGDVSIDPLQRPAGGYRDLAGYQTMLRYRRHQGSADAMVQRVCIEDLLEGRVSEALIRDRVVLLGLTAHSVQDSFRTPYGSKMRGVMIHAQMVSQILSAALEGRSLITVWPLWGEVLWVGGWSRAGGAIALGLRSQRYWIYPGLSGVLLGGSCYVLMLSGLWVPLIPAAFASLLSSGAVRLLQFDQLARRSKLQQSSNDPCNKTDETVHKH